MRCYLIRDDHVTVLADAPEAVGTDTIVLHSTKDLDARRFPTSRLAAIWNTLPGASPVKRFTSRPVAVKRVWAALEALPLSGARSDSKQAQLIALLKRPEGACLDDLVKVTGWQPHSVRGVMSGVLRKKLRLKLTSAKDGNVRVYRIQS